MTAHRLELEALKVRFISKAPKTTSYSDWRMKDFVYFPITYGVCKKRKVLFYRLDTIRSNFVLKE